MDRTRVVEKSRLTSVSRSLTKDRLIRIDGNGSDDNGSFDSYPYTYLTWQNDPTTTMTIQWHTTGTGAPEVEYREVGSSQWRIKDGATTRPFIGTDKMIHWLEINELNPNTDYEFRFKGT